jgi:hypothetical protein
VLTFKVEYSSASSTRQSVEVKSGSTMATMSDFVFPHPDGLATYRVYEDMPKRGISGDIEVMHGEAIDIAVSSLLPIQTGYRTKSCHLPLI